MKKMRKLKKLLSIAVAAAMICTSTQAGTFASETAMSEETKADQAVELQSEAESEVHVEALAGLGSENRAKAADENGDSTAGGDDNATDGPKKQVAVVWGNVVEFEYDDEEQYPEVTNADDWTPVYSFAGRNNTQLAQGETPENAGEYTVTVSASEADQVEFTAESVLSMDFVINSQVVSAAWAEQSTYEYNNVPQARKVTNAEGLSLEDLEYSFVEYDIDSSTFTPLGKAEPKEPGTYFVTAKSVNPNYKLSDETDDSEFEITEKNFEVQWDSTAFEYKADQGQYPTVANASEVDWIDWTYSFKGSDGNSLAAGEFPKNVGKYTVTVSTDAEHVKVSNNSTEFNITAQVIDAEWNEEGWAKNEGVLVSEYNAEAQSPVVKNKEIIATDCNYSFSGTDSVTGKTFEGNEAPVNPGTYEVTVTSKDSNYQFNEETNTQKFQIDKMTVEETTWKAYDIGKEEAAEINNDILEFALKGYTPMAEYSNVKGETTGLEVVATVAVDENNTAKEGSVKEDGTIAEAGFYSLTASLKENDKLFYQLASDTKNVNIQVADASVFQWKVGETVYDSTLIELTYNGKSQLPTVTYGEKNEYYATKVVLMNGDDEVPLADGMLMNVGSYTVRAWVYDVSEDVTIVINPLSIEVIPDSGQSKIYGEPLDETALAYTVSGDDVLPEDKAGEAESTLADLGAVLTCTEENAGSYDFELIQYDKENNESTKVNSFDAGNFRVTLAAGENIPQFTINPLAVTVIPEADQSKLYGEKEPGSYNYSVDTKGSMQAIVTGEGLDKKEKEQKIKEEIKGQLTKAILVRVPGESIHTYLYELNLDLAKEQTVNNVTKMISGNFELTLDTANTFEIKALAAPEVEAIDSRDTSFTVTTNLKDNNRATAVEKITTGKLEDVTTKIKITADFEAPAKSETVEFRKELSAYIANEGIFGFTEQSMKIDVLEAEYSLIENADEKWNGRLPAGTVLTISVVDAAGNAVCKEPTKVTVGQVSIFDLDWTGYKTNEKAGIYVPEDTALKMNGNAAFDGELVKVSYRKDAEKKKVISYAALAELKDKGFMPEINNGKDYHVNQQITAVMLDDLNIQSNTDELRFHVDDIAFDVSAIEFSNRDKEINLQLPELGTVTEVSIAGEGVSVATPTEFDARVNQSLEVTWSGKNLINSGSQITVTYTDKDGNENTTNGTVSRSNVSVPITFAIRPEVNAAGYLNGKTNTLIVSGTGNICEPIEVTAFDEIKTVYATKKNEWDEEKGSWEVQFDMTRFPEGQDFEISANYKDVEGSGHAITVKYNEYCASAAVTSPIFEAMSHISGMAEPNTTVYFIVYGKDENGDNVQTYAEEIRVDRFGHFVMNDVPMMFAGEESFDIYVTDIAGNTAITHYEIEEPGDPYEITSKIYPLGKFFCSAEREKNETFAATPVSLADFEEGKDIMELPLLMGMSYEVGTMTIQKTENGIMVDSEIQINEEIDAEDYSVEHGRLYVYTSRPTLKDLKEQNGQEYLYGTEIPLGEEETVWLVDEKEMTILVDAIGELELYDFEDNDTYESYQVK